jgi:hypothetical protein
VPSCARRFLDSAHIRGSYAGKFTEWSLAEFCDLVDKCGVRRRCLGADRYDRTLGNRGVRAARGREQASHALCRFSSCCSSTQRIADRQQSLLRALAGARRFLQLEVPELGVHQESRRLIFRATPRKIKIWPSGSRSQVSCPSASRSASGR